MALPLSPIASIAIRHSGVYHRRRRPWSQWDHNAENFKVSPGTSDRINATNGAGERERRSGQGDRRVGAIFAMKKNLA